MHSRDLYVKQLVIEGTMDVEELLNELTREEQLICKRIRNIVLETEPSLNEKLSYGVPYFYRHRRVCFIWPSSLPYGPKDALVLFGFCYGNLLSNSHGLLLSEGRKQVSVIRYSALDEIDEAILRETIMEAVLVDETQFKKKNG